MTYCEKYGHVWTKTSSDKMERCEMCKAHRLWLEDHWKILEPKTIRRKKPQQQQQEKMF